MQIPLVPITNPDYGHGVYRRRVRLEPGAGRMAGAIEDTNHGFRVVVHHRDGVVTAIDGEAMRTPLSTCAEALTPLRRLVGASVHAAAHELNTLAGARANCTHWLDLACLAINHIPRQSDADLTGPRQYDVEVTDEVDGLAELRVFLDGRLVHEWQSQGMQLRAPQLLADKTLFRGFSAWARECFAGDELEAAVVLQRGVFVAQARKTAVDPVLAARPASEFGREAVCYSYSPGNAERAFHVVDSMRDFTDTPEQLLRFK